jgi:hypothetical protein
MGSGVLLSAPMNLFDIEGVAVADVKGKILFKRVFGSDEEKINEVVQKVTKDSEAIGLFSDRVVMAKKMEEIQLIIYSPLEVNEAFVSQAFDELGVAFLKVVKTPDKEHVWKEYDQIALLICNFVHEGAILEAKAAKMIESLPKRNFEGVAGMKIPKGKLSITKLLRFLH